MKDFALLNPVPVRFRPPVKKRLDRVARRFKLTPSEIIRRALDAQLPTWETDNRIIIEGDRE